MHTPNSISRLILDASFRIHSHLGPGLLESVYETLLAHHLQLAGLSALTQVPIPITYGDLSFDTAFRADLLVHHLVIVELKSVEAIAPVHAAQLLTYLRLARKPLGLLINFNVAHLKDGITRIVNNLPE